MFSLWILHVLLLLLDRFHCCCPCCCPCCFGLMQFGLALPRTTASESCCNAHAATLGEARRQFVSLCGPNPEDCDPIGNQWICSSNKITTRTRPLNHSLSRACLSHGSSVRQARAAFLRTCVQLNCCHTLPGHFFYDGVTITAQDVNNDGVKDMLGDHIATAGSFFIEEGPTRHYLEMADV